MSGRLCIFCCHNFQREVGAGVTAEAWNDVTVAAFPARCGRPPVDWSELRSLLPQDCTQVLVLGRACIQSLPAAPADFPPVRVVPVGECFHLVAGNSLVAEAITSGGYLITPEWLANWQGKVREMGFSVDNAGEFFRDFAKDLVLFDTGIDPEAPKQLAALSQAVGLPARRIVVGLDHTRLLLARLVLEWRQEQSKQRELRHAGELADRVAAMDFLSRLSQSRHEDEVIASIRELFEMLFAPGTLHYLRIERDMVHAVGAIPEEVLATLNAMQSPYALVPEQQGFLLTLANGAETLGRIAVLNLAFPQQAERYLNLALAITGVCALAIENARNRKKLLEAEKMASLGMLVAGVAHEINTPVGVGLTAASALQSQSRNLADRFAARSMTQSDLNIYLEQAVAESALILRNLERIGHLIDVFKQVAVDGNKLNKKSVRLRACIEDVIASLGERLPKERIEIQLECDPALEIESLAGDWVSIFINLIGNSIKHGFAGRQNGRIRVQVKADAAMLVVDYRDDGAGMTAETLARVFDPFYTTDLQQGMGLGMHLVYNLVTHRMGGIIQCESIPGEGVHFRIEVPLEPKT
jgi:signal transduction histidine kinase